jgi:hypothetical protein
MDSATLRSILAKTDGSKPGIENAAGAMMRLYDTSPGVAVSEWRNTLQTCQPQQLLPLLYVANEVLQNSKRNRGTKFLEAFSPVLGPSLIVMVQRDPSIMDKVRRTAKIWGDRRVLSIRFVNELLQGLEPYREQEPDSPRTRDFSPEPETPQVSTSSKESPHDEEEEARVTLQEDTDDSDVDKKEDREFGDSLGHLDVDLNLLAPTAFQSKAASTKKRRRNSSITGTASKRRKAILSTTSLMNLVKQVSSLQDSLDSSKSLLKEIAAPPSVDVDQLVGDELLSEYQKVTKEISQVYQLKQTLHKIASDRKTLEQEAVRYIPWLQTSLKTDDDDVAFCKQLENKIRLAQHVHSQAKAARDAKRASESLQRQQQEEELRKKSEEDERKKFMESALKKETEAKPGMVWSRERQEYVYLNTEESWRD